jgi:hypothetical protein
MKSMKAVPQLDSSRNIPEGPGPKIPTMTMATVAAAANRQEEAECYKQLDLLNPPQDVQEWFGQWDCFEQLHRIEQNPLRRQGNCGSESIFSISIRGSTIAQEEEEEENVAVASKKRSNSGAR